MKYIYIVITDKGLILGAYTKLESALATEAAYPGSRVSHEPIINK